MTFIYLFTKGFYMLRIFFSIGKTLEEKVESAKQTSKRLDAIYRNTIIWRNTKKHRKSLSKGKEDTKEMQAQAPDLSSLSVCYAIDVNFPIMSSSQMQVLNELDHMLLFSIYSKLFEGTLLFENEQDAKRSLNILTFNKWEILSAIRKVKVNKDYVEEVASHYKKVGKFYDEKSLCLIGM